MRGWRNLDAAELALMPEELRELVASQGRQVTPTEPRIYPGDPDLAEEIFEERLFDRLTEDCHADSSLQHHPRCRCDE